MLDKEIRVVCLGKMVWFLQYILRRGYLVENGCCMQLGNFESMFVGTIIIMQFLILIIWF